VVTGFFAAIGATIDGIFGAVGELMKGNFKGAWDYIKGIFSSWGTFLGTVVQAAKTIFSNFVSWWTGVFQNAFNAIQKIFSGWSSYFKSLVNALKTIFSGVGTTISNFIANSIKSAVNGVLYTVENTVNGFISAINGAINLINKIPGVNIKKMTKIYIPKLATGGIATSSTIANIGENGKEAVLPLENNTEWMDTLADRIAARSGGASKIVLMVDGKELGWASINGINSITKQTGNLQLQLV
jgi:phage-related protein